MDKQQVIKLAVRSIGSRTFEFPFNLATQIEIDMEMHADQFDILYAAFDDQVLLELSIVEIQSVLLGKIINIFNEKTDKAGILRGRITVGEITTFNHDVEFFKKVSDLGHHPESPKD